ncbi:unnamed protein product, partial [Mesorhabditis spiculigera]
MAEAAEPVCASDRLPAAGDVIVSGQASYRLDTVIGDGGYGQVFMASEGGKKFAVKCEKYSRSMLRIECNVLRELNAAKCKHICEMFAYGSLRKEYVFVAMTLLGRDLHRLRSEMRERRFTRPTALRVGRQSLQAIEEIHNVGFLSRDIKPGNFAPGIRDNNQHRTIFLYDFGLARKYVDANNNVIGSRGEAHQRLDLSRRDDVESWFYMLVELTIGALPWRAISDRHAVHTSKLAARTDITWLNGCPEQYTTMMRLIDAVDFLSAPPYEQLLKLIEEACQQAGVKGKDRWDWDDENATNTPTISKLDSKSEREQKCNRDASQ